MVATMYCTKHSAICCPIAINACLMLCLLRKFNACDKLQIETIEISGKRTNQTPSNIQQPCVNFESSSILVCGGSATSMFYEPLWSFMCTWFGYAVSGYMLCEVVKLQLVSDVVTDSKSDDDICWRKYLYCIIIGDECSSTTITATVRSS